MPRSFQCPPFWLQEFPIARLGLPPLQMLPMAVPIVPPFWLQEFTITGLGLPPLQMLPMAVPIALILTDFTTLRQLMFIACIMGGIPLNHSGVTISPPRCIHQFLPFIMGGCQSHWLVRPMGGSLQSEQLRCIVILMGGLGIMPIDMGGFLFLLIGFPLWFMAAPRGLLLVCLLWGTIMCRHPLGRPVVFLGCPWCLWPMRTYVCPRPLT
jgi:hypothetical protein